MTTGSADKTLRAKEQKARCAGWRKISFAVDGTPEEGHGDTPTTISEVRVHNQTGRNKKCWK